MSDPTEQSTDDLRELIAEEVWSRGIAALANNEAHTLADAALSVVAPRLSEQDAKIAELRRMVDDRDGELAEIHGAIVAAVGEDDAMSLSSRVRGLAPGLAQVAELTRERDQAKAEASRWHAIVLQTARRLGTSVHPNGLDLDVIDAALKRLLAGDAR